MTHPAITIHQPWASWIAAGLKTIETRTHRRFARLAGQRIAIHAGKQWDKHAIATAWNFAPEVPLYDHSRIPLCDYHSGAVVALATVVEHRLLTEDDEPQALCFCPPDTLFGLVLTDVEPIGPHPARGQQGIWYWEAS